MPQNRRESGVCGGNSKEESAQPGNIEIVVEQQSILYRAVAPSQTPEVSFTRNAVLARDSLDLAAGTEMPRVCASSSPERPSIRLS
jgi:hypothetical protein